MKRTIVQDVADKIIQYKLLFSELKKEGRKGAIIQVAQMAGVHRNTVTHTLTQGKWGPKEQGIIDAALCVIHTFQKKEELLNEVSPAQAGSTLL